MKRLEREKLVVWAWTQAITPPETLVLTDMALSCKSPYAQVTFCVREFARRRSMDPKTVRKALARLTDRGLIEARGKKPMDGHRYMNLYQLNLDEKVGGIDTPTRHRVGGNDTPTSGGKLHPHPPERGESTPSVGGIDTPTNPEVGGIRTPPIDNIYTTSLQNPNRGGVISPHSENGNGETAPSLLPANLPPNVNPALARLVLMYPPIAGEQSFAQADGEYRERIREGHTESQMVEGVKRYAAYIAATGTAPEFTMHLKRFIGPDKQFLKAWAVGNQRPRGAKASKLERAAAAFHHAGYER